LTHGKRIFRMTQIHHAFEMRGWKEVKIDFFFSLIAIIGVVLGRMYVYMALNILRSKPHNSRMTA
ncbi:MAG: hypothetical protein PUE42_05600, partial [Subdoligranulum sp.]|nr:hypothetical protein [Subdoligranulum sp.]